MLKYHSSNEKPTRPKMLRFGLLSASEISAMSVCKVTDTTLYYRGLPASGGLLDPLMGSVDRRHMCASCMRDARTCQGHAGHIELSFPVYHIGFIDTVVKTLRTVCYCCSRVCATPEDIANTKDLQGKNRLTALHSLVRSRKVCPFCNMQRPSFARVPLGIRVDWPKDMQWESVEEEDYCTQPFTARDALSILRNMTTEDTELLGYVPAVTHPMDMIVQNLVVPPPSTRPAIYTSEGSRSRGQNELTVRLLEILKRSHEITNTMQPDTWKTITVLTPDFMERLNRLQYEIFVLVNNNVRIQKPSGMGRSGGTVKSKSLTDRLKGKEGRVRGNLMGKRTDFSARCVITPDAYFECDRVGVPYKIAMNLTIPEIVNASNVFELSKRVRIGTTNVHGAQTILHSDGTVTNLSNCQKRDEITLRVGDVVERMLSDDDVVLFNRQPSLHMHGMQSHRVRLMPGHTFRLSLVLAAPYNADFDGDEMNVHVPQSKAAAAECAILMAPSQNFIGAQSSKPVMGIVQDSLLGCHYMTHPDIFLTKANFCRIIGTTLNCVKKLPPPAIVLRTHKNAKPESLWTGKQVLSVLLPDDLYIEPESICKEENWEDVDLNVLIRKGELLCGILKKAHMGTASGGIIDTMHRSKGGVHTLRFMADIQRITHAFLLQKGHHVGIRDVLLSAEGQSQVNERLQKATILCEDIQREVQEAPAAMAVVAESAILRLLSKTLQQTGAIVNEHMTQDNAIGRMVNGGSKGSFINLSQICAALGQQSLEGKRIRFDKTARTLPCFAPNDVSLASRGMVYNSFSLGLSPNELFMHAIGGREGLVDTAVKTSQTGYASRRMNKSMEDHRVYHDATIRNALDEVISFQWGGDGMHPSRLERINLKVLTASKEGFTPRERDTLDDAIQQIMRVKTNVLQAELDTRVLLPFNPTRWKRAMRREANQNASPLSAATTERLLFDALQHIDSVLVRAATIDLFCHKNVKQLSEEQLQAHMRKLQKIVVGAKATPGESVGCIAAQSIGEPCTQLSVSADTMVLVNKEGATQSVSIGTLIDKYLPPLTDPTSQHDVMAVEDLKCVGVSPIEKVKWAQVTHVSRHPANGDMLTVTTSKGRSVKATASHSFLIRENNRIVSTPGSNLSVGDMLPIVKDLPADLDAMMPNDTPFPLTMAFGRLVGAVLAEGTVYNTLRTVDFWNTDSEWCRTILDDFSEETGVSVHLKRKHPNAIKDGWIEHATVHNSRLAVWMATHFGRTSHSKTLPGWIIDAPEDFVHGMLQSYFDGDGNIQTFHHAIRCHSVSQSLLCMISLVLAKYGIPAAQLTHKYRTPAGVEGIMHILSIPCSFAEAFQTHVGFLCQRKKAMLEEEVALQKDKKRRGHQTVIPAFEGVLEKARDCIQDVDIRKEFRRIQRKAGVTPKMLLRCRMQAEKWQAPQVLLQEFDYALQAQVWWDPIVRIDVQHDSPEMVYDFTVQQDLQSFMLSNGLFVHNTLNTFHTAGISTKNVTLGIPRLKELLDASKTPKTPCTTIRFLPEFSRHRGFMDYMSNTMTLTRMGEVVTDSNIVYDPDVGTTLVEEDRWMVEVDHLLHPNRSLEGFSNYVVRLQLHQDLMRSRHLTPPMIRTMLTERLENGKRGNVVSSEVNAVNWVIRIRFARVKEMMQIGSLSEDHEVIICHRAANVLLQTVVINGHPVVSSSNVAESLNLEKEGDAQEELVVHAYGNFLGDCAASHCVDWNRCTSNDVWEVYNTLGIEACTHVLFDQIKTVISFDGTYVDDRHISMLCDTITRGGNLMPLNRHGINRTDVSPLMRCSFEETTDVLCDAAVFAEHENARGVTTSIMTGQLAALGSGMTKVLFPEEEVCIASKPKVRLLRSTCRSFVRKEAVEQLEYVFDDQRPRGSRPLSPPTVVEKDGNTRKRARFRPLSPPLEE